FDSRLWLRLGKQTIVWGKTELFRTTDQFNPQDLALSSLPSLEESRISLWSARAILSLYDVGPLKDVRLEIAVNLDDFEPLDFGRCGEPYTIWLVCGKSTGLWAHGVTRIGLAGAVRSRGHGYAPRGGDPPADPVEGLGRHRGGRPRRVAMGPLQLRAHRLLGLLGRALPPRDELLRAPRRPAQRPAARLARPPTRAGERRALPSQQPTALRRRLLGDGGRRGDAPSLALGSVPPRPRQQPDPARRAAASAR